MRHTLLAATLLLAAAATTGCQIDEHKGANGDDVKIATPFGGLAVKTDDTDVLAGIGLPLYPGATLVKKDKLNGKDNGSADINMSFGSFQLKVKAASYHTADGPGQVAAFYKKALGRYGNVIQCSGKQPVGTPTRTSEGLTCDDDDHSSGESAAKINQSGDSKTEFKAGSKKHQHIVSIDPDGPGTKFGLVSLDLPVDFHFGDKDDKQNEKDKQ